MGGGFARIGQAAGINGGIMVNRMWDWAGAAALVLPLVAPSTAMAQTAAPVASTIIIVDASGSMATPIDASRLGKFPLAREALRRGLQRIAPQTRVGLMSFGHRRGDCGDVEVLRPAEPVDPDRIHEALEKLNPRGLGPLTFSLREAAKALPPPGAPRSVILIFDDADNCRLDLCQAAQELRAAGITVHSVGLALKPQDIPKTACLAQVTGGRAYNARTPEEVGNSIEEALRLASADPSGGAPPAAKSPGPGARPSAPPAPPAAIPADGPTGLYLRALLAAKGEPVSWPVHWRVSTESDPQVALLDATVANPYLSVPPGRYLVELRDGAASASTVIEPLANKPTPVNLALQAGTLRISVPAQRTGAPIDDVVVTIAEAGGSKEAPAGSPLTLFKGGEAVATLPAGRYVVRAELGLVRAERAIVVPAGSQGRLEIPLNIARLQLIAATRDGTPAAEPPMFSVVEDDPDSPKGRRELVRSAARQVEFVLPPGTYYVVLRQGGVEARERIALGLGDVVRRTLSVAAGRLAVSTKLAGATQPLTDGVSYRIERIDEPAPEVTTSRAAPTLLLAAGRYRVEGRYGAMNARMVREVEVRPGQVQQLVFEQQVATVRLRLTGSASEAFWEIRDEAGRTVWTTGQYEPQAILQAGRYTVRAETRDKRYDRAIEVRGGESRVLEVAAD
jgi:Ca-activated chloride channel homolog